MKRTEIMREFALRLRDLRLDNELSQEQAALRCGVSLTYYRDLENGRRNPTIMILSRIADGFKITLSELFSGIE